MTYSAPSETDHYRWHARLCNWATWSRWRGPAGYERPSDEDDEPAPIESDAEAVERSMLALQRSWLMAFEAVRYYYLSRLWRDEIAGYRELHHWLRRRYRGTWVHQSDGLSGEDRAERLLHRAVEALDCY